MKKNIYILIVFLLCFFIGLLSVINVGVYNDERTEQEILIMNIRDYAEATNMADFVIKYCDEKGLSSISSSIERDHGISAYYLFTPFLLVGERSPRLLSLLWHSYTYAIFFLGVIVLYFLCNELFKNKKVSLLASVMYFFSPRIFADGLYNNKDIVLLTLVLCCLYFGIKFIKNKDLKSAIIFGLCGAFVTNTRIAGVFIFGLCGLLYLIDFIKDSIKNKKINKNTLIYGFVAIFTMLIMYIVITPSIWGSGKFDLIGHLNWSLKESTKFSRWNGTVLFEGHNYNYEMNDFLPLHYLPKMILITTPIYILISFFIGLGYFLYNIIWKKEFEKNRYLLLVLLSALIPFSVAIITHTKLYNGWRHFYFVYGAIIIFSVYGIYSIYNIIKNKKVLYVILGIFLTFNIGMVLIYGINNTAYYNLLISHKNIENRYELDYYGASTQRLLRKAMKNRKDDIIYVYYELPNYGRNVLAQNFNSLAGRDKTHIEVITKEEDYNKLVSENKEVYLFYNNTYSNSIDINSLNIVYKETCMNDITSALYTK